MKFLVIPTIALVIFLIVNAISFHTSGPICRRPLRILKLKSNGGKIWFRIQQRDWLGIWRSCSSMIGVDVYAYIEFDTLEEAEQWINGELKYREMLESSKICYRKEVKRYQNERKKI